MVIKLVCSNKIYEKISPLVFFLGPESSLYDKIINNGFQMQKKLLIGNSANKHTTYLHDFLKDI